MVTVTPLKATLIKPNDNLHQALSITIPEISFKWPFKDFAYFCSCAHFLRIMQDMVKACAGVDTGVYETSTAKATGTSLNKRINEQNNGCVRAL